MTANQPTDADPGLGSARGTASGPGSGPASGPSSGPASVKQRLQELATPVRKSFELQKDRAADAVTWANRFRLYRVGKTFTSHEGNLLAAGMSYRAIFAIFAGLWLGFSIAGFWLAGKPAIARAVINIIDHAVPGLIGPNGLIQESLLFQISGTLGWTGIAAAVGLLWTATSWLNATRLAVRAMFGLARVKVNIVAARLGDFGLALGFGIVLLGAAFLSLASASILTAILDWIGIGGQSFWAEAAVTAASFLIVCALNILVLALMFRVLSQVAIPIRALLVGATLGGASLSVLSTLSGLILGRTGSNPLLASFTVFFGLLIWFNLVCRVILLAASWIAVGMNDRGISPRRLTDEQRELERARQQLRARITDAEAEVARADGDFSGARGLSKILARRRLTKAHARLGAIMAEADHIAALEELP